MLTHTCVYVQLPKIAFNCQIAGNGYRDSDRV
jgi:hypothetical protein